MPPMGPPNRNRNQKKQKPKNTKATAKRLFSYLEQEKHKIAAAFVCVLVSSASTLCGSYLLRPIINGLIDSTKTSQQKITSLMGWIADMKAELAKPQAPDLVSLLNAYYTQRKAGAYSQKGKISNLKEMNDTFNYLRANGIYSLEDLERRVSEHSAATESLKKTLDEQTARMKAIKQLYDSSAAFQSLKPVYDGLQKIKFEKPRAKYKAEHEAKLKQFYAARRKLTGEFPDGKVDMKKLTEEYDELEQAHNTTYGEFKTVRDDLHRLWKVKSCVDTAARFNERTEEQLHQNRPQTRHKKEELSR